MALIYEVQVKYNVSGNANRQLGEMETRMRRLSRSHNAFSNAFKLTFAVIGIRAAGNALIGFNAEIERMKLAMATGIAANMGLPFKTAKMEADKLFLTLQRIAVQSPGTTKDFMDMASMISRSVTLAGGDLKDLEQITKGAVLASKLYGVEAPMAALDIEQLLAGRVTVRDRLARQAISEMGVRDKTGQADHLAWNKLDPSLRLALTRQYFGKAFNDVAAEFENSIEGVLSTTKDKAQMLLGDIGKPLTEEVVKTAKTINKWLLDNQRQVSQWVKDIGDGLVTAFKFIKDAFKFISDNRQLITGLLEMLLVFKAGQTIAGGISALTAATNTLTLSFGGLASVAFAVGASLNLLANFLNDEQDKDNARLTNRARMQGFSNQYMSSYKDMRQNLVTKIDEGYGINPSRVGTYMKEARDMLMLAKEAGALTPVLTSDLARSSISSVFAMGAGGDKRGFADPSITGVQFNKQAFWQYVMSQTGGDKQFADELAVKMEHAFKNALADQASILSRFFGVTGQNASALAASAYSVLPATAFVPTKTKIDVSINKIEIASDDPDRFVMGMVQSFDEIVRNPTQAESAMRGTLGR